MKEIKVLEGKVVAPEGMKVGIVASRFNEIIVNKLLGGAVDGRKYHGSLGSGGVRDPGCGICHGKVRQVRRDHLRRRCDPGGYHTL